MSETPRKISTAEIKRYKRRQRERPKGEPEGGGVLEVGVGRFVVGDTQSTGGSRAVRSHRCITHGLYTVYSTVHRD